MISLTSLSPPASRFTLLGLLVCTSSALSFLLLIGGPGLGGVTSLRGLLTSALLAIDVEAVVGAGISSHSSPAISKSLRKKGHKLVRRPRDSWASAEEMGTGEDFTTARATSDVGRARRLRVVGVVLAPTGEEKSLQIGSGNLVNRA